jgi:hypothetical protein
MPSFSSATVAGAGTASMQLHSLPAVLRSCRVCYPVSNKITRNPRYSEYCFFASGPVWFYGTSRGLRITQTGGGDLLGVNVL